MSRSAAFSPRGLVNYKVDCRVTLHIWLSASGMGPKNLYFNQFCDVDAADLGITLWESAQALGNWSIWLKVIQPFRGRAKTSPQAFWLSLSNYPLFLFRLNQPLLWHQSGSQISPCYFSLPIFTVNSRNSVRNEFCNLPAGPVLSLRLRSSLSLKNSVLWPGRSGSVFVWTYGSIPG